ncbi:MAG TPA: hypothetical protein DD407_14635 [Pseudohongiella sp.]|nr:hypothetical protein [Pseudohongiella sp.]
MFHVFKVIPIMTSVTINLHISNALPHGNQAHSQDILGLWQDIAAFFRDRPFRASGDTTDNEQDYQVTFDAASMVELMEQALRQSDSFDKYRQALGTEDKPPSGADLQVTISTRNSMPEADAYGVASVFFQQLVLAANISVPGSIQLVGTWFTGDGSAHYEAQTFDSHLLHGAYQAAAMNEWPALDSLPFSQVWTWLDQTESSSTHTALKDINKALFTFLKVAQQRQEYSARTAMLVAYLLETLLACRPSGLQNRLGSRLRAILGDIPEGADCIRELQEIRDNLFLASQPVHRPPLLSSRGADSTASQPGQHNSVVEGGMAIALALLQDLVKHQALSYQFNEQWSRK